MKWYQHGDVTIKPVKTIPSGEILVGNTLMDGELTGHAHRVTKGSFQLIEKGGVLYFKADSDCVVTHEEHKPMTIPKGNYQIGQVREYDFFEDEIRKVRD